MATESFFGTNAGLVLGGTTHRLAVPLWPESQGETETVLATWSLDGRTRETLTITDSATAELRATVRYEDEPGALMALLGDAAKDDGLEYRTDLGDPGTAVACTLVWPLSRSEREDAIRPDRDRYRSHGEWETTVVLRRTDGGSWAGVV